VDALSLNPAPENRRKALEIGSLNLAFSDACAPEDPLERYEAVRNNVVKIETGHGDVTYQ